MLALRKNFARRNLAEVATQGQHTDCHPPKDDKPSENPSDKPSDGTDNKPDNTPSDDIGNDDTPKNDTDPDTSPDYTIPIAVSAVTATTVIAAGTWFTVVKLRRKR